MTTSGFRPGPAGAASPPVPPPAEPTGAQAHRVIFIDLARALAVVFMLYGHTISALLAPQYQVGAWYDAWQFQRGLTSSLFLLLSGFAFSIATARHWAQHLTISATLGKRLRRFALFIILGYALHLPASRVSEMWYAPAERWQAFLAVDVLQLIGVTFVLVQLLVFAARTRARFTAAAFMLAVAIVAATPAVWATDWTNVFPPAIAAYFSPALGSLFPLFPWAAYIFLGAGLGQLYARWGAAHLTRYASTVLLLPGLGLLVAAWLLSRLPETVFGTGPGRFVPGDVVIRWGSCLLILSGIAYGSRRLRRLPHVFSAVAQETLVIYFVHLCIVYGSVWNQGLVQAYGMTLTPRQTALVVVSLVASMAALASYWNWWKHARPHAARWTSWAAGAALVYRLL